MHAHQLRSLSELRRVELIECGEHSGADCTAHFAKKGAKCKRSERKKTFEEKQKPGPTVIWGRC